MFARELLAVFRQLQIKISYRSKLCIKPRTTYSQASNLSLMMMKAGHKLVSLPSSRFTSDIEF
jgi:hypothetical protein